MAVPLYDSSLLNLFGNIWGPPKKVDVAQMVNDALSSGVMPIGRNRATHQVYDTTPTRKSMGVRNVIANHAKNKYSSGDLDPCEYITFSHQEWSSQRDAFDHMHKNGMGLLNALASARLRPIATNVPLACSKLLVRATNQEKTRYVGLVGEIDAICLGPHDEIVIVDLKTGSSCALQHKPPTAPSQYSALQLELYAILLDICFKDMYGARAPRVDHTYVLHWNAWDTRYHEHKERLYSTSLLRTDRESVRRRLFGIIDENSCYSPILGGENHIWRSDDHLTLPNYLAWPEEFASL